jgi:ribonuclease HI
MIGYVFAYQRYIAAGPSEIHVFSDASYQAVLGLGSWAFYIADFGIENVGLAPGPGIENFEIMAALSGLERVLAVDHTSRRVRLHIDSQYAIRFLRHAIKRTALPTRRTLDRVRGLFQYALDLTVRRRIVLASVETSRPEHIACHRNAAKRLRQELAAHPAFAAKVALRKEEDRLQCLEKERFALQRRLDKIEQEIVLTNTRSNALLQLEVAEFVRSPANRLNTSSGVCLL